jgi:adenylylsulfate kinase
MPSEYKRSLVKGITWEGFSFIITLIAVYLVYNNFMLSLKFSLLLSLIKIILFFVHERAWKNVKWGKY